jgi:hypothetical protein
MKRLVFLVFVAATATMLLQTGCGGDGVGYSRRERLHRAERVMEWDAREYADDVDLFWQTDQNTRLSKWSIP